MLLIDSLDKGKIDLSLSQTHTSHTRNTSLTLTFTQKHKIPELNIHKKSASIPTFETIQSTKKGNQPLKFLKIVQGKSYEYLVVISAHYQKKEILIQLKPILPDLASIKTSKYRFVHALSYLSTINPNHNLFSFRMNSQTHEVFVSAAIVLSSLPPTLQKINKIINSGMQLYQQQHDRINIYVNQKGFLNTTQDFLNESSYKFVRIISQMLNKSCDAFKQFQYTDSQKQDKKYFFQGQIVSHSHKTKMSDQVLQTFGTSKYIFKSKIRKPDMYKLLAPVKENLNVMNSLYLNINIKQPLDLKWQSFCSNKNNKIQVANVKVQIQNNQNIIIKSLVHKKPKTINGQNQFENTRKVFEYLKNKHCVNILQSYSSTQRSFQQSLFTDYCKYGSLSSFLKTNKNTISLRMKITFMYQIASSLQFLKSQNIVHMDIKPSNFLVAPDLWVKLTDFGEATFYGDRSSRGWTPPYVAPQRFKNVPADYSIDIYSFGVLIYQMITGKLLFPSRSQSLSKFQNQYEYNIPVTSLNPESLFIYGPKEIMIFLYDLIIKCVNPVPSRRPTIYQIIVILKSLLALMQYLLVKNY